MSGETAFTAALIQICSTRDVDQNLHTTGNLIREAKAAGAQYVQTPEVTTLLETERTRLAENTQPETGNPAVKYFSELAAELNIWLHIGSMAIAADPGAPDKRYANRAFLFAPNGALVTSYDKIHMFDVDISDNEKYAESRRYAPGYNVPLVKLPWANLGITICYDMRFPALYRALAQAGADIITAPSAFTVPTGKAHWHTLLRARAIEAQCFILAAAQAGDHEAGRQTYGHSIAISPWGDIIAEADGETTGVTMVDIDITQVADARRRVPSLKNDRPFDISQIKPTF